MSTKHYEPNHMQSYYIYGNTPLNKGLLALNRVESCEICGSALIHVSAIIEFMEGGNSINSDYVVMPTKAEPRQLCQKCHRKEHPNAGFYMALPTLTRLIP